MFEAANLIIILLLTFGTGVLQAAIFVRPGQCVTVGSTEVCASLPDQAQCVQTQVATNGDHIFTCQYDLHPHAEMPGLKTYALVRTTVPASGKPIDTIIKNYGITDKLTCESEAEKKNQGKQIRKCCN